MRAPARTPPTRQVPAHTTMPPALSIRCRSSARLGLWSSDIGIAATAHTAACHTSCDPRTPLPSPSPYHSLCVFTKHHDAAALAGMTSAQQAPGSQSW